MSNDRVETILNHLKLHNLVTVEELVEVTGASPSTIRRELSKLTRKGTISRVHGGATLNRYIPIQTPVTEKAVTRHQDKALIGKKAASLIREGDCIILDAGTTTMEIARNIPNIPLTVFTPDLNIALVLSELSQVDVIVTGGRIDKTTKSCAGDDTKQYFEKINPNLVFLACNAWIDESPGVSTPSYSKVIIKKALLKRHAKKVLVVDSSKYGATSLYKICDIDDLDVVVTDKGLPEDICESLKKRGVIMLRV
jgi:DeoR/GlpR family transcriptional regulator of sugar metabolism